MIRYLLALRRTFGIKFLLVLALLFSVTVYAQQDSLMQKRFNKLKIAYGSTYILSSYGLYNLWYADYPQSSFHFFDDNNQWQSIDKFGHAYSAYILTRLSASNFYWAGVSARKSNLYGSISSFTFLTTIEIFDGFSQNWGFSWGDMIANSSSIALFWAQESIWQKQIVKLKYSYTPTDFREIRPGTLGENELQALFKDYNGQTYWASINLNEINSKIKPRFLNLAFGIGATNMVNAKGSYTYENGEKINPFQQYYLSLDLDLERIKTEKKWLKTTLKVLNIIKVPFPALEVSPQEKAQFHWLHF